MKRTKMWLRVSCVLGLALALGCAGSEDNKTNPLTPAGGLGGLGGIGGLGPSAGASAGSGGSVPTIPPTGGISGGKAGMSAAGAGAGGGGVSGAAAGGGAGGAGMSGAGAGAGGGGESGAGAGGMAGEMAGAGGAPGGIERGPAPTEASASKAGPYEYDTYTSGFARPMEYGGGTIYYPTSADATPPFGVVIVVPGFTAFQSSIRGWGPFLASHGIITMTIDTITTGDFPAQRALGLMDALNAVKLENDREGSPIKGKVDVTRLGVSGWSMGGGGTLIAAKDNPELKAAVSFAAWGPSGGAMNKVPALMFEATADFLAASMSDGFYAATPETTPKMLFEVQGSSHNVANNPANHDWIIGKYGLSWFKVFLEGDERYRQFLTAPFPNIVTSKAKHNLK
jgi:dienelactone hydrolase